MAVKTSGSRQGVEHGGTIAKLEANRRNALKSTGPKTPTGKSIAARNATKHGLLSQEVVLWEEDRSAFRALAVSLWDCLQPVGALEHLLVDRIVAATWRLRRVHVIEAGLCGCTDFGVNRESLETRFIQDCHSSQSFLKLSRYEVAIERGLYRVLHELERLQLQRSGGKCPKPVDLGVCLPVNGQ